jgi:hypothetical protein
VPQNITVAVFVFGAILLLLALSSGGFKLFGAEMSGASGHVPRAISGVLGALLIGFGLWEATREDFHAQPGPPSPETLRPGGSAHPDSNTDAKTVAPIKPASAPEAKPPAGASPTVGPELPPIAGRWEGPNKTEWEVRQGPGFVSVTGEKPDVRIQIKYSLNAGKVEFGVIDRGASEMRGTVKLTTVDGTRQWALYINNPQSPGVPVFTGSGALSPDFRSWKGTIDIIEPNKKEAFPVAMTLAGDNSSLIWSWAEGNAGPERRLEFLRRTAETN